MKETAKRDYKDEYKKFQSSDKSKKYRAELNKYNRKKGTYGNGDGKDASHKGGKISGFEKESVNRGRREKSRLKKEQKITEVGFADKFMKTVDKHNDKLAQNALALARQQIMKDYKVGETRKGTKVTRKLVATLINNGMKEIRNKAKSPGLKKALQKLIDMREKNMKKMKEQKLREVIRKIVREDFAGAYPAHQRKKFDNTRRKQSEVLGYKLTGQDDVKTEIDDATVKEGNVGITTKKGKTIELTHKKSGKEVVVVNNPSVLKKYAKMGYLISMPEGKLTESGIMYKAGVKKYGKEGMKKIQSAAGKDKGHEEIGKIKDKYEKGKKEGVVKEGPKFDEVKANMEKTMGLLVRKMGLKSVGRHLVGKGGMSFFLDDPKEAKKLQKYLLAKIKDVRIINLDKEGGDETNFVVYAKVFDF